MHASLKAKDVTFLLDLPIEPTGNIYMNNAKHLRKFWQRLMNASVSGKNMRERTIEQKLTKAVKDIGGLCYKFTSPGNDVVPDRLLLMNEGKVAFVELKAPGKKLRPLQLRQITKIRKLGFKVYVIDSPEQIGGIIDEIQTL